MADWSAVDEYLETPDAPGGWEPTIFATDWGRSSPAIPFRPLDYLRVVDYEERGAPRAIAPPPIFPTVVVRPTVEPDRILIPEDIGDETVVFEEKDSTVFGPPTFPEPQPAYVPERVVVHPPREPSILDPIPDFEPYVEDDVAIDWGDLAVGVLDVAAGVYSGKTQRDYVSGLFGGGSTVPASPVGVTTPRTVTVDTVTGKVTPCRRRRRRRLLTSSDLSDLAALKAIVGGGAAMNAAVVKAVRR